MSPIYQNATPNIGPVVIKAYLFGLSSMTSRYVQWSGKLSKGACVGQVPQRHGRSTLQMNDPAATGAYMIATTVRENADSTREHYQIGRCNFVTELPQTYCMYVWRETNQSNQEPCSEGQKMLQETANSRRQRTRIVRLS